MANDTSIDDIEAQLEQPVTPAAPKLSEIKLDGADVPDDLRGKSVAELVQLQRSLEQSLKLSELARMQPSAVPVAEIPKPEPELTDEQLAEVYQENPVKAMRLLQEQAERRVQKNLEARLGTIATGAAASIESQIRQKYPEEFAVLGSEISQMIHNEIPDKSILTNPEMWDKLIGYVRGQPGNFEKLVEARIAKKTGKSLANAQAEQDAIAGMSFASSNSAPALSGNDEQLDSYTLEIAKNLGMSPSDYVKWRKIA